MTDILETDDYHQELRVLYAFSLSPVSSAAISVPSHLDQRSGVRIVLWSDIQVGIRNADHVRNGNKVVAFMKDDGFNELVPRRIQYHHGVVLDVVLTSRDQEASVNREASALSTSLVRGSARATQRLQDAGIVDPSHQTSHVSADIASVIQQVSNSSIATSDVIDRSLIVQSTILDKEEQRILHRHSLPSGILEAATISIEENHIPPVDDYINDQLRRMGENGIQEGDLFQMHTLHLLQQMLEKQQQTLNRQVLLEKRVQALMTQNYELHEYPIPRLFIVLPKPKKHKDKFIHPFKRQFRLYFLCECGEHTTGVGRGNLPDKIHLAKHEGYDLDQPNEFFERYGSYVLAMLRFLKYGTMAAGIVVPPLALFKVVDGLGAIQKSLAATTNGIRSLVDQTIKHIQDIQGNTQNDIGTATGPMALEDIEALEGADLRQLQLYLNDKDKGRVLGDLFRVFTPEGHVKWVCIDHYKENYRKAAMQRLKDVIKANDGLLNSQQAYIKLGHSSAANQFYEALIKARGIQCLDVNLNWSFTLDDLRKLASAVSKANIIDFTLGKHTDIKEPPLLDMINNGCRYGPIVEMMCNGRIQEMMIEWAFDDFFKRIDVSLMATTSRLQKLSLPLYTRPYKPALVKLLKLLPCLADLILRVSDINESFEDITANLSFLPCLTDFHLLKSSRSPRLVVKASQSRIKSTRAIVEGFPSPDIGSMLQRSYLTEIEILGYTTSLPHQRVSQLTDMVRQCSKLRYVELGCSLSVSQAVMDTITSTRERILLEGGSCELRRVKLHLLRRDNPQMMVIDSEWDPEKPTIAFEFQDGLLTPFVKTTIDMGIELTDPEFILLRLLTQFGWSLSVLKTSNVFYDEAAAMLDDVTSKSASRITSLIVDTSSLTMAGLELMVNVINRSYDLQQLEFTFHELYEEDQQSRLELLIRRYGKILTGLELTGFPADEWIPKIMALCPTRLELPGLEFLSLNTYGWAHLGSGCVQWIASMVSGPSRVSSMYTSSLSTRPTIAITSGLPPYGWSPLRDIRIENFPLQPKDWEVIIEAMDYSALKYLRIYQSGFSVNNFKRLVDCIPANSNPVASLCITIDFADGEEWESQVTRLRKKVPNVIFSDM
ncbi:MAG: hypothetical protein J3Q66DRAFT_439234 [Benniella sp.]|nr:MAG: hypothetical protein J3Q66DRAFT_439234 [Benniella sp.]